MRTKYDWQHLYLTWQRVQADNPGISLKRFSEDNGIKPDTARISFKRIQDRQRTTEQMTTFGTVEDTAILCEHDRHFVIDFHDKVLKVLIVGFKRIQEIQLAEKNVALQTAAEIKASVSAVAETIRLLREIMPFILELRDRGRLDDIVARLADRKIDISQAAIEVSMLGCSLPEALKIMLSKVPAVMIANNFELPPSSDDLDQRALETLEQVKWQLESFIPQRRQEVIELKQELKGADSFKQDVAGSPGKGGDPA